jgi:hypothetical protein
MSTLPTSHSGIKKWTVESDDADDKKKGIKEDSAQDKAIDKKRGVK